MNKLIVITGATKGIGRAIAEKFAKEGFHIATCSRKQADLDQLKAEFELTYSSPVITYLADLSDKNEVKGFTDFINGLHRPVDVLVNNAGYFTPGKVTE